LQETGLQDQISDAGCLSLLADEAEFKADRDHIAVQECFGFSDEVLGRQAIKALEPELSDRIGLAVLSPQNRSMKDPDRLVTSLADRFTAAGGRIDRGEVTGFARSRRHGHPHRRWHPCRRHSRDGRP
jgi:D-amino-acid dehydrogenase